MIRCVDALNYRCLRYVRRTLEPMHVLVGPNASGKTTFLDVISFLGTFVSGGVEAAIQERTRNPVDLVWGRKPGVVELAIEAAIPARFIRMLGDPDFDTVRYEVQLEVHGGSEQPEITGETALLKTSGTSVPRQTDVFPWFPESPDSILTGHANGTRVVLRKVRGGNDNFYSEVLKESGKGWAPSIRLGPRRSALGNLIEDEEKFPVTTWLKALLKEGVQKIVLNSLSIRQASPPGQGRIFRPDGSNLPWVIGDLIRRDPESFRQWVDHLTTALPDLDGVRVVEREDDRHAYLMVRYRGGLEAPSWMVSDGTLRLMALTILAYLRDAEGIYLIEEPENGIHPTAVETVYQALSSVYDGQVLVATHSPILLAIAAPKQLLCFAKASDGATDVVRGDEHPALSDWRGQVSLGDLFAAGVLG